MWFLVHNSSCTRCDYSSSPSSSLKSHTMIHSGEKPFSFKQCNYSFTWSSHFKTHMLTHSGEKLYSCSHCSLSCTTAGNPNDHVCTHSGEKPFHCDQCNSAILLQLGICSSRSIPMHVPAKNFCMDCQIWRARKQNINIFTFRWYLVFSAQNGLYICGRHSSISFMLNSHL